MPQQLHQMPWMHLILTLFSSQTMGRTSGPQGMNRNIFVDPCFPDVLLEPQTNHALRYSISLFAQENIVLAVSLYQMSPNDPDIVFQIPGRDFTYGNHPLFVPFAGVNPQNLPIKINIS